MVDTSPLKKLFDKHKQNSRVVLTVASLGLLLLLVSTFTLPFNKGLFSRLFVRPNSSAAGVTVNQDYVFELTLSYPSGSLSNPWEDATVSATFTTPSGKIINQKGFYYDVNTYKVRVPAEEVGTYNYTVNISGPSSFTPQTGSFTSIAATQPGGFIHTMASNPYRLGFPNGNMFNLLGLNDCFGLGPDGASIDPSNYIAAGNKVDIDTYFATYQSGGFNFLRFGPNNCFPNIFQTISTSGNTYLVNTGKAADQLFQTAHSHNFHIMMDFFAWNAPYSDAATNTAEQAAIERYIDYIMARYGAYVDIWELDNEESNPIAWSQLFTSYIQKNDPYNRIVTNSWDSDQDWTFLGARDNHSYYDDTELNADSQIAGQIYDLKHSSGTPASGANFPIIFGEDGNSNVNCNWNSSSALRLRERTWTAFFNEGEIIFWNSSMNQNYCTYAANYYIGPEERGYTAILQNFTANTDPTVQMVSVPSSNSNINVYGLQGNSEFMAYLQHTSDHTNMVTTGLTLNLPFSGTATWIDPSSGNTLATSSVSSGSQILTSPSFVVDAALKITSNSLTPPTPMPTVSPTPTPSVSILPTPAPTLTPAPTPASLNMNRTSHGEIFFDNFNRNSVGSNYTPSGAPSSNWSDNGSQLVYTSNNGGQAYETLNGVTASVNSITEYTFNASSFSNVTPRLQVSFGSNAYYFDSNFNAGTVGIFKSVSGASSASIATANYTFSPNTNYDVKLQVGGSTDKLWINNQLVASGADSTPAAGTGTLAIWVADFGSGVSISFDNLAAYTANTLTVNGPISSWALVGNNGSTIIGSCNTNPSADYSAITSFPPDYLSGTSAQIKVWVSNTGCSGPADGDFIGNTDSELFGGDVFNYTGPTPTPTSTPNPSACPSKKGDFDSDGVVNLTDLSIFAASFGTSAPNIPNPCTDLNGDGKVDLTDLSLFAAVYGT